MWVFQQGKSSSWSSIMVYACVAVVVFLVGSKQLLTAAKRCSQDVYTTASACHASVIACHFVTKVTVSCYCPSTIHPGHANPLNNAQIAKGFCSGWPQHGRSDAMGTPPKLGWDKGGVTQEHKKPAISPKWCKIGPRLLLRTNSKSHSIGTKINDLEWRIQGLSKICTWLADC